MVFCLLVCKSSMALIGVWYLENLALEMRPLTDRVFDVSFRIYEIRRFYG